MANAGQDDVDRALAAAGVPAMRYFNFRNLRFVRGPETEPVETFGVNADDHDLHVIHPPGHPPGMDAPDASAKHQPHFGYDPAPAETQPTVEVPPIEPDMSEAAALDAEPAHAIAEPEPEPAPVAPAPVVAEQVTSPATLPEPPIDIPVVPPRMTAPPMVTTVEPPPAVPVVPPQMVESPPAPETKLPEPVPEPPVVAALTEPPPPSPEPLPAPKAEVEPPQPVATAPVSVPLPAPEPPAVAKMVEPPPPPPAPVTKVEPPPRPPVREPPTVKVVETEAPVFDLAPAPPVAAPVAAAEPAEAGTLGSATVERETLTQMFSTLAGRAEPRPRAPTWGIPEALPDTPAPIAQPARDAGPAATNAVPQFRMSDVRYAERAPASAQVGPSRAAEPAPGQSAVFSLAERLAARPDAPPPSRAEGQGAGSRIVTDAPARARTMPSPFQRRAPASAASASEPSTAEAMFRRL